MSFVSFSVCGLTKDEGTGNSYTLSYYYDTSYGECYQFAYYGTGGNANRFSDKISCQNACKGMVQSGFMVLVDFCCFTFCNERLNVKLMLLICDLFIQNPRILKIHTNFSIILIHKRLHVKQLRKILCLSYQ